MSRPRAAVNLAELAAVLGWRFHEVEVAYSLRVIPDPDVRRPAALGPRWSPRLAGGLYNRRDELAGYRQRGAAWADEIRPEMRERLGVDVPRAAVWELARMGFLHRVNGSNQFARWTADVFDDLDALDVATRFGAGHGTTAAAELLGVRTVDVERLATRNWLRPVYMADNHHPRVSRSAGRASVPIYRHGDLLALQAHPRLDWAAARAAQPGQRSPFTALRECLFKTRLTLDAIGDGLRGHVLGHRYWWGGRRDQALALWRGLEHAAAAQHVTDAERGDDAPVDRCAAFMSFLEFDAGVLA